MPLPSYPTGTTLRDNDPRKGGRIITVKSETFDRVFYFLPVEGGPYPSLAGRKMSIDKRRIYEDGKPRHQGYSLVHRPGGLQA